MEKEKERDGFEVQQNEGPVAVNVSETDQNPPSEDNGDSQL